MTNMTEYMTNMTDRQTDMIGRHDRQEVKAHGHDSMDVARANNETKQPHDIAPRALSTNSDAVMAAGTRHCHDFMYAPQ